MLRSVASSISKAIAPGRAVNKGRYAGSVDGFYKPPTRSTRQCAASPRSCSRKSASVDLGGGVCGSIFIRQVTGYPLARPLRPSAAWRECYVQPRTVDKGRRARAGMVPTETVNYDHRAPRWRVGRSPSRRYVRRCFSTGSATACTVRRILSPLAGPAPPYARTRIIPLTCSFGADDGIRTRDPHLGKVTIRLQAVWSNALTGGFVRSVVRPVTSLPPCRRPVYLEIDDEFGRLRRPLSRQLMRAACPTGWQRGSTLPSGRRGPVTL